MRKIERKKSELFLYPQKYEKRNILMDCLLLHIELVDLNQKHVFFDKNW
jgi:hypothetical protein